ncbi:MAG: hypothetical protein L6R40_007958, partial [Gallowayella cf. fulva]
KRIRLEHRSDPLSPEDGALDSEFTEAHPHKKRRIEGKAPVYKTHSILVNKMNF